MSNVVAAKPEACANDVNASIEDVGDAFADHAPRRGIAREATEMAVVGALDLGHQTRRYMQ